MLAAAHNLDSFIPGLRGATYETLFGLLASTGLRISEALHLLDSDVDSKAGMLAIRQTKFAKSRYVPLHPSTVEALKQYRSLRNDHIPLPSPSTDIDGNGSRFARLHLFHVHPPLYSRSAY